MHKTIENIIQNKIPCYFVSPHYDDAALSAGGLIYDLAKHTKVTVITVFTKGDEINTVSAKKALENFGTTDATKLYKLRTQENQEAFGSCGVTVVDLAYVEALWRKIPNPNIFRKMGSKVLAEFGHVYPTYRFHIQTGKVSSKDNTLIKSIASDLAEIIPQNAAVFCPEGIGGHVDHVATRLAVEKMSTPIYWADQPYTNRTSAKFGVLYKPQNTYKKQLISFYKSQIVPLFGKNTVPHLPENFLNRKKYVPESIQGYSFHKSLSIQKNGRYEYAIYKNNEGKMAFAKILSKPNGKAQKFMQNEINAYTLLAKHKIQNSTVEIPRLIAAYEDNFVTVMLLEHIEGKQLSQVDAATKKQAIEDVFGYMEELSAIQVDGQIFKRDMKYWIGILPFVSLGAFVKHPKSVILIARAFLYILWRMNDMLKEKELVFSHRDLGNWNIVKGKTKTYIYDLQLASFAPIQLDYAIAALKFGTQKYACNKVISLARQKKNDTQFNSLGIILALYDLSLSDGGDYKTSLSFIKNNLSSDFYAKISNVASEFFIGIQLAIKSPINFLYSFTLSNSQKVTIQKYDPVSQIIAQKILSKISSAAPLLKTHFIGSASLQIDGLADIDILVECETGKIPLYTKKLSKVFGVPMKRKREFTEWSFKKKGFQIEVSLMNPSNAKFVERITGYYALKNNSELLSEYEILKKSLNGQSVRSYTRKRMIFLENISA